jgi:molybdopterin/thiamine biosynthesis adenylyltransferase
LTPQLKDVAWERTGTELRLVYDLRDQFVIDDPDGTVEKLVRLLGGGGRTVAELGAELSLPEEEVAAAIAALDAEGLLEDRDRRGWLHAEEAERYFSNLGFFESFASLARSREDFQLDLSAAHVLVLGTGGLNSTVVPHLAGLGVGRLTLLDRDVVQPRNFARQYLYHWDEIGLSKVGCAGQWVRDFDPSVQVVTIDRGIEGVAGLLELLDQVRPTVVAAGIDSPSTVDEWVNAACVTSGIPYVRGGMYVTQGIVWSVLPGRSACLDCTLHRHRDTGSADDLRGVGLYRTKARSNRGIGPVAGLLGSLAAFELLRILTGFEPPAYAGRPVQVDFAAGCAMRQFAWERVSSCPTCGDGTGAERIEEVSAGEGQDQADREHPGDACDLSGVR